MRSNLLIGEIAKKFGLSTQAIRYYEKLGLIKSPPRSAKGYRLYSSATIKQLQLIQYAQKFGLSLNQIKDLLEIDNLQNSIIVLNNLVSDRLKDLEQQAEQIETTINDLGKRQQQINRIIAKNNTNNIDLYHRSLLDLFERIERNLLVNNPAVNKVQQLLKLYNSGERNFQSIELNGAELNGTFLCYADFSHAEMMLASLNEVSMEQTKLNRAYLSGADFIDAYLYRAELIKADLFGADLNNANLTEANLTRCNLGGANLENANLQNANLTEAILIGANLQNANLTGAIVFGCNFLEANLTNVVADFNLANNL